jgi:hypothetical protein
MEHKPAFLDLLPTEPETTQPRASLVGYPDIAIDDVDTLKAFLTADLQCQDLDTISPHLWIMSTQSSANISRLHEQRVKGRTIILAEEPKLHLIWFYDRVYIKPMPRYLLSRAFWDELLLSEQTPLGKQQQVILRSALGLFRSYAHLVRYESDFRIAKNPELVVIPKHVSWAQWCPLRARILAIQDEEVSGRFQFGEIRLTRLNLYCKILLRKAFYYRTHRLLRQLLPPLTIPVRNRVHIPYIHAAGCQLGSGGSLAWCSLVS